MRPPHRHGSRAGHHHQSQAGIKRVVLFIDAREVGSMISRRQKELTDSDIQIIADTYHNWWGKEWKEKYKNVPGFCKSANIQEVRKNKHILTPGRYIDFKEAEEDGQAYEEKMKNLTSTLKDQMQKAKAMDEAIKASLKKEGYEL